ncbi:MAG: hypothetical protein SO058_02100, partial [Agathobaculum sp.]|nr:hypothetical protein [Agathobaculum sp.]
MRKMHKKFTERGMAWLLTVAMVVGLLPIFPTKAGAVETDTMPANGILVDGGNYVLSTSRTGVGFTLSSGTATVTVPKGIVATINNIGSGGSPFTLAAGTTLYLVIDGQLTTIGQSAGNGANASRDIAAGGAGGYAGINVIEGASLLISGNGILYTYGGDAGNGGYVDNTNSGSGGGGGAGAAIGGNGGAGGRSETYGGNITNGNDGMPAGNIIINAKIKLYAFGGGGGSSGISVKNGSAGAGGYPAAGIGGGGGGGGGGNAGTGIGGFSGSNNELVTAVATANGYSGKNYYQGGVFSGGGGGYFAAAEEYGMHTAHDSSQDAAGAIGGGGGAWAQGNSESNAYIAGNGGASGSGGNVILHTHLGNVHAYNGSYMTEADGQSYIVDSVQTKASPIYAQLGFSLDDIRAKGITDTSAYREDTAGLVSYLSGQGVARNIAPAQILGIGSGAGYTETSNGTLKIGIDHDITSNPLNIGTSETYYDSRKPFGGSRKESRRHAAGGGFRPAGRPAFISPPCAQRWEHGTPFSPCQLWLFRLLGLFRSLTLSCANPCHGFPVSCVLNPPDSLFLPIKPCGGSHCSFRWDYFF